MTIRKPPYGGFLILDVKTILYYDKSTRWHNVGVFTEEVGMWTVVINWHWLVGFAVFCLVFAIIKAAVDDLLGITGQLKGLPRWKVTLHDLMVMIAGTLLYALFFTK